VVYETGNDTVDAAVRTVLEGGRLDRETALGLLEEPLADLEPAAAAVRDRFRGETVDTCSIVNAKSGGCPEDCGFCAQSAHYDTGIEEYGFLDPNRILESARRAEADGVQRFGIVVAERGVDRQQRPEEWADLLEAIRLMREETDLAIDASLGDLTRKEAEILAEAGVQMYNHNVETSPEHFPEVVSTHDFEDRVRTLRRATAAGMDLCAGVVLGMGESGADRVDAALALREIGVASVPVNVLNPIEGTPAAERVGDDGPPIPTDELLRTIAVYRLLLPETGVHVAGGREVAFDAGEQHRPLEVGADGMLTGDYLTTDGRSPGEDLAIIDRAGLRPATTFNEFDPAAIRAEDSPTSIHEAPGTDD
jgi:biotin synthase